MKQGSLIRRICILFLVCAVAALAVTATYALRSFRVFHEEQVAADLLARAQILRRGFAADWSVAATGGLDAYCKEVGRLIRTRITVILPDGRVVADSDEDPARMDNHGRRPEILAALRGETGQSVRFSDTLRKHLMYVAIPITVNAQTVAVVRTSTPLSVVDWGIRALTRHVAMAGVLVVVLFALVTLYISRRITRPLFDMRRVAERLAAGDLGARLAAPPDRELAALADTLNRMAAQLDDRIQTITRQRNEQEAVFASMAEGVLAVDREERIIRLNHAAARLLEVEEPLARGRSIQEMVRNPDLQSFIAAALLADGMAETEVVLYGNEERCLQLHGTALLDEKGQRVGALIVLHDVTRLKRLEVVRQEFVANVSHELKTPITAIKACVDTLGDESETPEDRRRFLAMLTRHVGRLEAIVADLLSLSRIEFDAERGRIPLEVQPVCDVLQRAVQNLSKQAEEKRIRVSPECDPDLAAPLSEALLEQAVGNLLDNAIKYSPPDTHVSVTAGIRENALEIRVADEGPGIEKKHLSRIFERFYRVDSARSRALGGTGLGLAIVKHIALAHRGTVSVESTPGTGSVFTIRIPRQ